MSNSTNADTNIGGYVYVGILQILFIGLKLTGYIDWSWWWVLSPIWITMIIIVLAIVAIVVDARR